MIGDDKVLVQMADYHQIYIGFSGGLDSTVLLHWLASNPLIKKKLRAVHVNHGLSPNAAQWALHCKKICENLGVDLFIKDLQLDASANIEETARLARYQVFEDLLEPGDCCALGHHQQDQAETLLLQISRGAGIEGLSSMPETRAAGKGIFFLRPLLKSSKVSLLSYASEHQLAFIEDESNHNNRFSRNFLRKAIFPLLETRWPKIIASFSRTASHCQQAQTLLYDLALIDCPALKASILDYLPLLALSRERISNVIRFWLKHNQARSPSTLVFDKILKELIYAKNDARPLVSWSHFSIKRQGGCLYFFNTKSQTFAIQMTQWKHFPKTIKVKPLEKTLVAKLAESGIKIPVESEITLRFRQGGETFFYRRQTKSLKKLFQEWKVPHWQRNQILLVYINHELAMVMDYAISDNYYSAHAASDVFRIQFEND